MSTAFMRGTSGADLLVAYVAGVEAATRLGAVGSGHFHQVGFHPTGMIGVFGCTLAAGTLMGLSPQALTMAQGIALSMAAGSLEFLEDGAWTKRMHPGWAAQSGITAAALGREGFVGPTRAYEGRFGVFNSYLQGGLEDERWGRATAGLGSIWETTAIAVKPLPACHFTHACADAAMILARQHKFEIDDIVRIKALVPGEVVKTVCEPVANKRRPANAYDAQFSIPYLVAASLIRGRFTLAELEPEALNDEAILRVCDLVDYEVDPRSTFPRHYTGDVQISLRDGRVLMHREAMNRGCADRPLSNAEIIEKFTGNARMRLSARQAAEVQEAVLGLDRAADVRPVDRSHLSGRAVNQGPHMLPLSGVRVIAVEQYGAGPFGSMLLGDLGAEVIKIENPAEGGDIGRAVGPVLLRAGRQPFLPGVQPQQAQPHAQPETSRGARRVPRAGAVGRRDAR